MSARSPRYFCGMNEYCADNGTCQSMSLHPLLGQPCRHIPPDAKEFNCGPGLQCLGGTCLVCKDDYHFNLLAALLSPDKKEGGYCRGNAIYNDPWTAFLHSWYFRFPPYPRLFLLFLLVFCAVPFFMGLTTCSFCCYPQFGSVVSEWWSELRNFLMQRRAGYVPLYQSECFHEENTARNHQQEETFKKTGRWSSEAIVSQNQW